MRGDWILGGQTGLAIAELYDRVDDYDDGEDDDVNDERNGSSSLNYYMVPFLDNY